MIFNDIPKMFEVVEYKGKDEDNFQIEGKFVLKSFFYEENETFIGFTYIGKNPDDDQEGNILLEIGKKIGDHNNKIVKNKTKIKNFTNRPQLTMRHLKTLLETRKEEYNISNMFFKPSVGAGKNGRAVRLEDAVSLTIPIGEKEEISISAPISYDEKQRDYYIPLSEEEFKKIYEVYKTFMKLHSNNSYCIYLDTLSSISAVTKKQMI